MKNRFTSGSGGLALVGLISISALFIALALLRFGGVEGIQQRVLSRLDIRTQHPEYVPTPMLDGNDIDPAAVALAIADSQSAPTPAPILVAEESDSQTQADKYESRAKRASLRLEMTALTDQSIQTSATPSPSPAAASQATLAPSVTPAPSATPAWPPTHRITGLAHYWQTWNNCGPATLAMNLSYFNVNVTQEQVRLVLRPEKDDKNVNPEEMAAYALSQGLKAVTRVNGDSQKLRALLLANVPVLVETWYEPKPNDGMGHYRLLVGYDDAAKNWIAYDSYESRGLDRKAPYAGITMNYSEFDRLWHVFGRSYVVVYDEARAPQVEAIIGEDMDDTIMWQRALAGSQAAVKANTKNAAFAWFNMASALTAQGDFSNAAKAYDQARQIKLPWRMLWYQFGPFRAYYEVGRFDEVISLADATIRTAKNVEELFYWRGMAQSAKGDVGAARASFEKALQLQPSYVDAQAALAALP